MRICPQCNSQFGEDYFFCLNDGTMLTDSSGEVETRVGTQVRMPMPDPTETPVACTACGMANRGKSKFCKKCGAPLIPSREPVGFGAFQPPSGGFHAANIDETRQFQPGIFTPPNAGPGTVPPATRGVNQNVLLGAILGAVVIIGGVVIYRLQAGEPASSKAARNTADQISNAMKPVANKMANAYPAPQANAPSDTSVIGKTGVLLTNQHIRSTSNRYAEDLGVHYQNARMKILDVYSYSTADGPSTWYKVHIINNGCDNEGRMGCGNDLLGASGAAAMEGWMNGKNIRLE